MLYTPVYAPLPFTPFTLYPFTPLLNPLPRFLTLYPAS
jgi:hypothetical protein